MNTIKLEVPCLTDRYALAGGYYKVGNPVSDGDFVLYYESHWVRTSD